LVLTRIESGVSRSIQPSLVCSSCAAVDNFLVERFLGFMLNPGIDASTSRIVAGLGLTLFDVSLNSLSTKGKGRRAKVQLIDKFKSKVRDKPCPQAGKYTYHLGLSTHVSQRSQLTWQQIFYNYGHTQSYSHARTSSFRLESKKLILQVFGRIGR